jgi:hypothetical protein
MPFCYAQGMTGYLYQQGIRIFDYPKFAESLRERLRENAEALAESQRSEDRIYSQEGFSQGKPHSQDSEKERGEQPGLVHIFGAMEACPSYRPWHDKVTGKTYLKPASGKCLTYYFYFIDEQLGCAMCVFRPGVPFGCSSTATDTTGWPIN